jgi:hypothetical protein
VKGVGRCFVLLGLDGVTRTSAFFEPPPANVRKKGIDAVVPWRQEASALEHVLGGAHCVLGQVSLRQGHMNLGTVGGSPQGLSQLHERLVSHSLPQEQAASLENEAGVGGHAVRDA